MSTPQTTYQVCIVANGEYPQDPLLHEMIHKTPHLVVCDGAISKHLKHSKRLPDCVIGDGDSSSRQLIENHQIPFIHVAEQESNDLTKAVRYALEKGWTQILIVGASGLREDHALANIFLLRKFTEMGAHVVMKSDYGEFVCSKGERTIHGIVGQQISFLDLEHQPFSVYGVKYPIHENSFDELWQATLNEITTPQVTIQSQGYLITYLANEIKRPATNSLEI